MNNDQLEREIEEALSVEPSPQFAAQVRARIAKNPMPSRFWLRWSVATAAGLATAAAVTLVFLAPQEPDVPKPAKIVTKIDGQTKKAPANPVLQPPVVISEAAAPSRPPEPEVLIDPREIAAFQRFVEGVQEDRIDLKKLIELQQAAAKTTPIQEIALMPLEDLQPIVIESLDFGARRIEGGSL